MMKIFFAFIVSLVAAYLLFKLLFDDKDDFINSIKLRFIPNVNALFTSQSSENRKAKNKLEMWFIGTIAAGFVFLSFFH